MKSIPENTSTEQLKELFQRHGDVTKVVMPPAKSGGKRDFGFVHYAERSSALKAVKDGETYEVNGNASGLMNTTGTHTLHKGNSQDLHLSVPSAPPANHFPLTGKRKKGKEK